jgi:NADH-quinone oxidoreductase subunit N
MLGLSMLSLAGIPPLPGFVAKFLIFKNVIAAGYPVYAVLGLIGSYLGIYFYLRVIQYAFMSGDAVTEPANGRRLALSASVLCVVPAALVALFPGWFMAQL